MKLAVMMLRNSKEMPMFLHDPKTKVPRMLLIGWAEQLSMLLVFVVAALWLWFGVLEPVYRHAPEPAVRVPRALQVNHLEPMAPLRVGEKVFVCAKSATGEGKIAALPGQSVFSRTGGEPEKFIILGTAQYYVTTPDGAGQVFVRKNIRGTIQHAAL